MIEIVLLGAPRGKERPRFAKDLGVVYTPEKTRNYEAALKFAAQQIMGERPPLDGPIRVAMNIVMPIAPSWPKKRQEAARLGAERPTKKPDLDNVMKILDSLNLVAWIDDAQIVETTITKRYGDKPGLWIRVEPIGAAPNDIFS